MSRKHYREVAEIIRERVECGSQARRATAEGIARDLADMFKRDNPNFRRDRFYRACGMEEYQYGNES